MHDRLFTTSATDAVFYGKICRLRHTSKEAQAMRDEIEAMMKATDFLKGAPFTTIGLDYIYGLINRPEPRILRISKKYEELTMEQELNIYELIEADKQGPEATKYFFMVPALRAVIAGGQKYKLNTKPFEEKLAEVAPLSSYIVGKDDRDTSEEEIIKRGFRQKLTYV